MNDEIPIEKLVPNTYNPRKHFDDARMKELEKSIKNQGIVTAITVRPLNGSYEVVAGMRRYTAAKNVGLKSIPAMIRELSDEEAKLLSLTENLERAALNKIEEAEAYADYLGWDEDLHFRDGREFQKNISVILQKLANQLPISEATIRNRLELLHLPEKLQTMVAQDKDKLDLGKALEITKLRELWSTYEKSGVPIKEIKPKIHTLMESIDTKLDINRISDRVKSIIDTEKANLQSVSKAVSLAQEEYEKYEKELMSFIYKLEDKFPENIAKVELTEKIDWLKTHFDAKINELSSENIKRISTIRGKATAQRDRYLMNLKFITDIITDTCPYCGAGVTVENLQKRVNELYAEIKALDEEEGTIGEELKTYRDNKRELEKILRDYNNSIRNLEQQKKVLKNE